MERRAFFKLVGLSAASLTAGGVLGACSGEEVTKVLAPSASSDAADSVSVVGQPEVSFSSSVDVLVVGSGVAGLSAAIAPLDAGFSVMIADKLDLLGGESYDASGVMCVAGSSLQQKAGVKASVDDAWSVRKKALGEANGGDTDKAKRLFYAATDWINLLADQYKAQFANPADYTADGANSAVVLPKNGLGDMESVMVPLRDGLSAKGATFATGHRASAFIVAQDGAVRGMRFLVEQNSAIVDVQARCVIMATGGYASSQPLYEKYLPDWKRVGSYTTASMGEGQLLCAAVGGQLQGMDQAAPLTSDLPQAAEWGLFGPTLIVDALGRRFAREDSANAAAVACYADGRGYWWTVFGPKLTEASQSRSMAQVTSKNTKRLVGPFESKEELAEGMGLASGALDDAFSAYDAMVEAGRDESFGRALHLTKLEAPYYALKQFPVRYRTRGGAKTDDSGHLLNGTGAVVPNVYCCGAVAVAGGEGLASCGACGMLVGQTAADDLKAAANNS